MDRNSMIGFGLLVVLLISYVAWNNHSEKQYIAQRTADSIAYAKANPKPVISEAERLATLASTDTSAVLDSVASAYRGVAQNVTLENEKVAITFTTKGAQPSSALLKEFKTFGQQPLYFFEGAGNQLSLLLPENNGAVATSDLYFQSEKQGNSVIFTAVLGNGKSVSLTYTLPPNDYKMQCQLDVKGMNVNNQPLTWKFEGKHTEQDVSLERAAAQVYYQQVDGDDDYFTITDDKRESISKPIKWVGYRQLYFSSALIAKSEFANVDIKSTNNVGTDSLVAKNTIVLGMPNTNGMLEFDWYIGPNDYKVLKNYNVGLENMVPLGFGIFTFVKYINKFFISPIFYFLSSITKNYGIVIMLLTIIIRLLLSFFTYKSYLSSAKMRVLKPEMDAIRAKHEGDQQGLGMAQMKLYKEAGVNPLGGCLPALLQLPILVSLYYFIPTAIELRQESFLWAKDLSTYDSILNLPFNIPFYGSHVSLFTLLMTASSLFLALYNKNMSADPNNPMMKYLPYVFPIMLIGFFNKMAAALTFYYFFSNLISIVQQWVIQKFIIDEDKIHAQIQANKNKPVTKSKWQERLEEMQKMQAERMKQQQGKK